MSTSDRHGDRPLTRKQLREIRLTGATPVIGEDEAAAAAQRTPEQAPAAPLPRAAEPIDLPSAETETSDAPADAQPLTRRQVRAMERLRTASVPVTPPEPEEPSAEQPKHQEPEDAPEPERAPEPEPVTVPEPAADEETSFEEDVDDESDELREVFGVSEEAAVEEYDDGSDSTSRSTTDEPHDDRSALDEPQADDAVATGERPVVSPAFGKQVLGDDTSIPSFSPSFDELITSDSGGTNRAPNTLVFTHPGEGTLSGPVASTGELLVTGSYELPRGIGSQGHAHGSADGKEIDAVLIDGELPPASSPTPISASSAVSTVKPAGEVIRPPAPEKGNKLMLTLAITAGGLALALAVALIIAFTTNVF